MRAHQTRMIFQSRAANLVVCRGNRFVESIERYFRVNHDRAVAGKTDDHVRPDAAVFSRDCFLFEKVAILQHARQFDDAPQLNLAPTPANVRRAQGFNQVSGFRLKLQLRSGQAFTCSRNSE